MPRPRSAPCGPRRGSRGCGSGRTDGAHTTVRGLSSPRAWRVSTRAGAPPPAPARSVRPADRRPTLSRSCGPGPRAVGWLRIDRGEACVLVGWAAIGAGRGVGVMDEQAQGLLDVAAGVLGELDLEVVIDRLLESARELTGAQYAALGVLDASRTELERFIAVGIDETVRREIGALPHGKGVLGELIRDPVPLRLSDVGEHPRSYGFPLGHPPMRSFLGVPDPGRGGPVREPVSDREDGRGRVHRYRRGVSDDAGEVRGRRDRSCATLHRRRSARRRTGAHGGGARGDHRDRPRRRRHDRPRADPRRCLPSADGRSSRHGRC